MDTKRPFYNVDFRCDEFESDRVIVDMYCTDHRQPSDREPMIALRKFGVQGDLTKLTYHSEPTPDGGMYHAWAIKIG